jgi:AcrR family transcriptional regulator
VFSVEGVQTGSVSAPRTARDRIRDEVTREILAVAREHLARDGAAALSLRSIARRLEMAPSALYRYFDGRDALLSALILTAYESLADEAELASEAAYAGVGNDAQRWVAVPRAMRWWALAHPQEWGLIFGTPVPGYQAPQDTVVPYARLAAALVRPLAEADQSGHLGGDVPSLGVSEDLAAAVAPVVEALLPGHPPATVVLALQAWTMLIGVISLELFGHWRNTILEPELFFERTIADLAAMLGLS